MCEPAHSIVQTPEDDENGNSLKPQLERHRPSMLKRLPDNVGLGWLHLSRIGSGHSETLQWSRIEYAFRRDGLLARYDNRWWSRQLEPDFYVRRLPFHGLYCFEEAVKVAQEYADRVTGDLKSLRRFVEASVEASNSPHRYIQALLRMFNGRGRDMARGKLKSFLDEAWYRSLTGFHPFPRKAPIQRARSVCRQSASALLGMTRRRDLLIPCWADDDKLWLPGKEVPT